MKTVVHFQFLLLLLLPKKGLNGQRGGHLGKKTLTQLGRHALFCLTTNQLTRAGERRGPARRIVGLVSDADHERRSHTASRFLLNSATVDVTLCCDADASE